MPQTGAFKAHDGIELFTRTWPATEPKASMVLVHGYGEHCGRYDNLAQHFNDEGISVYSYDHRGHGKSAGKAGLIVDFNYLVEDLKAFIDVHAADWEGKPLFLLGHSMGGLVSTCYLETYSSDFNGYISSSPFLAVSEDISPLLLAIGNLLGAVLPFVPVVDLDSSAISRDPEEVRKYDEDPLVYHGRIVARTGAQLNAGIHRAHKNLEAINRPLYILHGAADQLAPIAGAKLLYERAQSEDKTMKVYEDGYHELFNDINRDQVIEDLVTWLRERL